MHYLCMLILENTTNLSLQQGNRLHVSPSQSRTTLGLPKPYLGLDKRVGPSHFTYLFVSPTCIHLSNAMSSFLLKANSDSGEK